MSKRKDAVKKFVKDYFLNNVDGDVEIIKINTVRNFPNVKEKVIDKIISKRLAKEVPFLYTLVFSGVTNCNVVYIESIVALYIHIGVRLTTGDTTITINADESIGESLNELGQELFTLGVDLKYTLDEGTKVSEEEDNTTIDTPNIVAKPKLQGLLVAVKDDVSKVCFHNIFKDDEIIAVAFGREPQSCVVNECGDLEFEDTGDKERYALYDGLGQVAQEMLLAMNDTDYSNVSLNIIVENAFNYGSQLSSAEDCSYLVRELINRGVVVNFITAELLDKDITSIIESIGITPNNVLKLSSLTSVEAIDDFEAMSYDDDEVSLLSDELISRVNSTRESRAFRGQ